MKISAKMVRELRDRTSAGVLDCQKALKEANGDLELAITNIRKAGKATADKKSSRIAAEGIVVSKSKPGLSILLEVNCETDFVARDESFIAFANKVADLVIEKEIFDVAALSAEALDATTVESARQDLITKIGENINIRTIKILKGDNLGIYVHSGKIAAIADLAGGTLDNAKDIAMHIVASKPDYLNPSDIAPEVLEKEKSIQLELAMKSGKPADIAEKIVLGRMNKFMDEVSLTGQNFVKDPNLKVSEFLKNNSASVNSFVLLTVGEGIDKESEDFASEVAAQIESSKK